MKLEELTAKLPGNLQPFAAKYGPVVLAWTAADIMAWIELLIKGDVHAAYAQVLDGLDNQQAVDEWAVLASDWRAANADNAARIALQKSAVVELLKIVLAIALASVGL